jgi:hypothetical protein
MIFSGNPKGFLGSKHYYLFSFLRIGRKEGRKERRKEGRKEKRKEGKGGSALLLHKLFLNTLLQVSHSFVT